MKQNGPEEGEVDKRRRRMREFAELCRPTEAQLAARESQVAALREMCREWSRTGNMPPVVGVLSSGEHAAVCIGSGNSRELEDAFVAFIMLDGWLQRLVLEERGLAHFVDTRLGADVP